MQKRQGRRNIFSIDSQVIGDQSTEKLLKEEVNPMGKKKLGEFMDKNGLEIWVWFGELQSIWLL